MRRAERGVQLVASDPAFPLPAFARGMDRLDATGAIQLSEYDDLLEGVLPEREGESTSGRSTDEERSRPKSRSRSGSTSKKAKRGTATTPATPSQKQARTETESIAPTPARRGMSRQLERSGRCPMYAPRGTVCKTCGKVHPV